jgi:hypothetical protein
VQIHVLFESNSTFYLNLSPEIYEAYLLFKHFEIIGLQVFFEVNLDLHEKEEEPLCCEHECWQYQTTCPRRWVLACSNHE